MPYIFVCLFVSVYFHMHTSKHLQSPISIKHANHTKENVSESTTYVVGKECQFSSSFYAKKEELEKSIHFILMERNQTTVFIIQQSRHQLLRKGSN